MVKKRVSSKSKPIDSRIKPCVVEVHEVDYQKAVEEHQKLLESRMDRPRRSTRNSLYASQPVPSSSSTTPSASTSSASTTPNPYKKPTYLANRPSLSQSETTPSSSSRGRGGRGRGRYSRGANGSTPSSGRKGNARPECVATRVESRRSTGGSNTSSNKKKKRGTYNSNDFHYGSDFESDQNYSDTEPMEDQGSNSDSSSVLGNDDGADSDSDFSITSATSKLPTSRMPSPPVPLWMDSDKVVEELELPKSSDDILLDRDLVMKAVAIYEPLRRFHQIVRLSPFRFEDFCAALGTEETSALLTEIHIQLLKTILRVEEANSTMFGPNEVKDSLQAVLFFIDNLTWPECLRAYSESDPNWADIHEEICSVEYPFCRPEKRLKILSWMVDQLLATNPVREVLLSENIKHEDHCRACNRLGQVVMCETCTAVYHLACIVPAFKSDDDSLPPDDWKCPVCIKHTIAGISDCTSELERAGLLIRHENLGNDRHGRKYWFLVRRIVVESEDGSSVWYYSTPLQVEELLYRLDEDGYEAELVENIRTVKDEIVRQMEVTEKITDESKGHRKTYIEAENAFLKKIHEERELAHARELEEQLKEEERLRESRRIEEDKKVRDEEESKHQEEAERKRIREERLLRRNQNKFVDYNPSDWSDDPNHKPQSNSDAKSNHCDDKSDTADSPEIKEEAPDNVEGLNEPGSTRLEGSETLSASQIAAADTQVIDSQEMVEVQAKTEQIVDSETKQEAADENEQIKEEVKEEKPEALLEVKKEEVPEIPSVNRRKSKALLLDWDTEERMTRLKATGLYKLGHEGAFRSYVNNYYSDALALSKVQHTDERDKKRYMSHKFSVTALSEIKWSNFANSAGLRSNMVGCLRSTLVHLEGAIPSTLLHVNWPLLKKAWISAVQGCVNAKDFSKAMIALSACMRPSTYITVWSEALAHHKLIRTSAAERDERKKAEKRDKKDRDDEEDRLRLLPQFVKHAKPIKHNVQKQKGEEYRVHGRWGWVWMSSHRKCEPQDARKMGLLNGPYKHVIQVKNDTGKVKTILIDPNVFDKLMAKRSLSQRSTPIVSPTKTPSAPVAKDTEKSEKSEAQDDHEKMEVDEPSASSAPLMDESGSSDEKSDKKSEDDKPENVKEESDTKPEEDVKPAVEPSSTPPETDQGQQEECQKMEESEPESSHPTESIKSEEKSEEHTGGDEDSKLIKTEIKEEKETNPTPSSVAASTPAAATHNEDVRGAMAGVGRKFRTELVNVSLGIVGANRILYPKIAHKSQVLDNLLARRVQLQKLEEEQLLEKFGKDKLDKVQSIIDNGGKIPELEEPKKENESDQAVQSGVEVLDDSFPIAGIYRFKCYSYLCQKAAAEFLQQKTSTVREYEYKCYSPMCRLKFFVQDTTRKKQERLKQIEKAKLTQLVEEVQKQKMFTQTDSTAKVFLKQLPDEQAKKRNQVKYPMTSSFKAAGSKDPNIFVLPQWELRRLARTAGAIFTPSGFAPAPKTGSWAWPYPCGRPLFKTGWQYKTVHAQTLAAAALQLRILWACVKWDDFHTKPPNPEGRNQITTDMEIITWEILNHRIVGRFMERVQYLRKKTVVPIDAPKTIRAAKIRDSSDVTPSRSGLRKRKRAESPDKLDPVVLEEWVDEDKFEIWEIKLYHEKQERKGDAKSATPSTRTKSGVTLNKPEKYDPSPEKQDKEKSEKNISVVKTAEMMREQLETELKMQRAVHLSKRDNHPKNNSTVVKTPIPTASQQLQQQQAAAGLPANPRSYGASGTQKKVTVVATKTILAPGGAEAAQTPATPGSAVGILNRKSITNVGTPKIATVLQSPQNQQKITVFRTPDGKLQVRGLLPGQSLYQTADGKVGLSGAPLRALAPGSTQQHIIQPQNQTQTYVIQGQSGGQLQQTTSQGVIHVHSGSISNPQSNQPLINISNPSIRTVLAASSAPGNTMKPAVLLPQQHIQVQAASPGQNPGTVSISQGQVVHTYSSALNKTVRKPAPKLPNTPTAIAPAAPTGQVTGTLNAQGQIVLTTRSGQVIQGGQIMIATSQPQQQGTIVVSGGNVVGIAAAPAVTTVQSGSVVQAKTGAIQLPTPITSQAQVQSPSLPGSNPQRMVLSDGTKTIVVSGGANLTHEQLQQILQIQIKKPASASPGTPGGKPQIVQQIISPAPPTTVTSTAQTSTGQQLQIQQTSQGTMQIIQQMGSSPGQNQQVQLISGGQNLQQFSTGQGQIVLDAGHQMASIGGMNVIVKKIVKSPLKPVAGTPIQIAAAPGGITTAAQIQQMINANKGFIRVDTKTGLVNFSPMSQIQQQQQQTGHAVSTATVTKSAGLPISIVSPSKTTKIVPTILPQTQTTTPTSATMLKTTANTITTTGARATKVVSASPATIPTPIAAKPAIEGPKELVPQVPTIPTAKVQTSPASKSAAVLAASPVTSPLSSAAPVQQTKVAAQFIETSQGPRVIVTGFKTPEPTPAQLHGLQTQIYRQIQPCPATTTPSPVSVTTPVAAASPGPAVPPPKAASPVKSPVKVRSPASSPTKSHLAGLSSPTSATLATKSPPNSANIDAAIAAVASDVDAPVILPAKSPKKASLSTAASKSPKDDVLKNITDKLESDIPSVPKAPKRKSPKKTPHQTLMMTPVEPSSVPQPVEQDVVISSTPDGVGNEVEISENKIDTPRFVLSQDLLGQGGQKHTDNNSMTFFAGQRSPQQLSPTAKLQQEQAKLSNIAAKSGSSRRKSPVKTKQNSETSPVVSSPPKKRAAMMSPLATPKQLLALNKHKELLRKDMSKKRVLLERDLMVDIKKEIAEELGQDKGATDSSPEVKPRGKKRKSSESNSTSPPKSRKQSTSGPKPSGNKKEKLICVCRTPFEKNRFYISCDVCANWFHGECVGVNQRTSNKKQGWHCPTCSESDSPTKLYCICKQPYDDSQFYIGCDSCEDWFHGRCVGILPKEGDIFDDYVCPNCDPNTPLNHANLKKLTDEDFAEISKTMKQIQGHKNAWPFMKPVDLAEAPNYQRVIKEPMDLQTIAVRVDEKIYGRLSHFIGDIAKIFENCRYYNPVESPVFKNANSLEIFFAQKLRLLRANLEKK